EETAELVKEVIEEEVEPVQEAEIPAWLRELEPEVELEEQVTLPSVEDIVIEPELSEQDIPDWLRELEPESELVVEPSEWEAISEVVPVAEEPEAEIDLIPDWLAQLEQEPSADLKTSATLMTEDVEGEPAWLVELQAQEERASEQITVDAMPDWLEQLHEAEPRTEVVSAPVEPTPGIKLEPEPESIVQQVGPEIGETPVVEVVAPALKPVSARVRGLDAQAIAKPGDFQTQRDLALAYLRDDDPDAAARVFSSLVVESATIGDLVEDLETAVQSYPDSAALYQLLGDAYMRADRYAAALEAYKKSLANLG
ncbi:MAG: hypothetical protein JW934_11955, partial [Anaerolineae bacterium]|nr:hypothetical protein [Anaerolineae bacterium]